MMIVRSSFPSSVWEGEKKRQISFSAVAEAEAGRWWLWSVPFFPLPIHWPFLTPHTLIYFIVFTSQAQLALFSFIAFNFMPAHLWSLGTLSYCTKTVAFCFIIVIVITRVHFPFTPSSPPHPSAHFPCIYCVCVCPLLFSRLDLWPKESVLNGNKRRQWVVLKNESVSISVFLAGQKGGGLS